MPRSDDFTWLKILSEDYSDYPYINHADIIRKFLKGYKRVYDELCDKEYDIESGEVLGYCYGCAKRIAIIAYLCAREFVHYAIRIKSRILSDDGEKIIKYLETTERCFGDCCELVINKQSVASIFEALYKMLGECSIDCFLYERVNSNIANSMYLLATDEEPGLSPDEVRKINKNFARLLEIDELLPRKLESIEKRFDCSQAMSMLKLKAEDLGGDKNI